MTRERDTVQYIDDMLECIEKIESYRAGVTEEEFAANTLLQDAVIRRLEIIGEAVKHVPRAVRARHPDIPWRAMTDLRNVLIHDYSQLILQRIWQVVTEDLPAVKPALAQVRAELENTGQ